MQSWWSHHFLCRHPPLEASLVGKLQCPNLETYLLEKKSGYAGRNLGDLFGISSTVFRVRFSFIAGPVSVPWERAGAGCQLISTHSRHSDVKDHCTEDYLHGHSLKTVLQKTNLIFITYKINTDAETKDASLRSRGFWSLCASFCNQFPLETLWFPSLHQIVTGYDSISDV